MDTTTNASRTTTRQSPGSSPTTGTPARPRSASLPLPTTSAPQPRVASPRAAGKSPSTFEGLDPAKARGKVPLTEPPPPIDPRELLARMADAEDTSSLAFMLDALNTVRSKDYSAARRDALKKIATATDSTRGYLAEQMGLRTAKNQRKGQSGFAPQNPKSTTYLRTSPNELDVLLSKLGVKKGEYVVNSSMVLERLRPLLSAEDLAKLSVVQIGGVGLWSLRVSGPVQDLKTLLHDVGATPSPFQLYKLLEGTEFKPAIDPKADAKQRLIDLKQSAAYARVQELARSPQLQSPIYGVICHLIDGVSPEFVLHTDPLSDNALQSLDKLMRVAAASDLEPSVLALAADLMMDELMVVLGSSIRTYMHSDFEAAASALEDERCPNLSKLLRNRDIARNHYYASSGMDALSTALTLALGKGSDPVSISRATQPIDYFEMTQLLDKLKRGTTVTDNNAGVVIAALHPSTPYKKQDVPTLVASVEATIAARTDGKPVSLILDTTLETGSPELDQLWAALDKHIQAGRLNVFCCKSFHKYATLGSAKLSAGMVTLVGRYGSSLPVLDLSKHDQALGFSKWPEAQLMTHILKYAAGDELTLIKAASENAKFVDAVCWPAARDGRDSAYMEGIPLLIRAMGGEDVRPLVELLNIDKRDSFAFLRTSFVPLDMNEGSVRLNPGLESKTAMVEFFYAAGHLVQRCAPGQAPSDVLDSSSSSIDVVFEHLAALAKLPKTAPEAPYVANIRASYLYLAARMLQSNKPPVSDPKLRDALGAFIGEGMVGVTRGMQAQLAARYLDQCCLAWPSGDAAKRWTSTAASLVAPEDAALLQWNAGFVKELVPLLKASPPTAATLKQRLEASQ